MAETYTYQAPPEGMTGGTILRASDGAFIPLDLANRDYQQMLQEIAEGNPAPEGWSGPTNADAAPDAAASG